MFNMIAAMTPDRVIGVRNGIPWKNPEDMAFFKETTQGSAVIMGRKTFESLGRPSGLPNRLNIVISTTMEEDSATGVIVRPDFEEAVSAFLLSDYDQVFFIGGGEIYRQALDRNLCDKLYLTIVDAVVSRDTPEKDITRFPELPAREWTSVLPSVGKREGVRAPNLYFTYTRV